MIFFLSLGIFLSVVTKETPTSLFACIMFWLISVVLITKIAFFVSGMAVPIPPTASMDSEVKKQVVIQRLNVANSVLSLSPAYHFQRFSRYMLSPYKTEDIFAISRSYAPLPLSQSLAYSWHNISLLLVGTVLLFVVSYMRFMKEDL